MSDDLWRLDEDEVTMLRGVAWVDGQVCRIEVDATGTVATMTVGGNEGEPPTVLAVPVMLEPEVRHTLRTTDRKTFFYVGKLLRSSDTKYPEAAGA